MSQHSSSSCGKLSTAGSFELASSPLEISNTENDNSVDSSDPPLSRSSTSSSFARHHSWTELRTDMEEAEEPNNKTILAKEQSVSVDGNAEADEAKEEQPTVEWPSGDDSIFADNGSEEDVEMSRNIAKLAIFGLIVVLLIGKLCSMSGSGAENDGLTVSGKELRAELEKQREQRWELERELAATKGKLEAERERKDETEKELRKAHERMEADLRDKISLQKEFERAKTELEQAEERVAEAEKRADDKWMGGGFAELATMYKKSKESAWVKENLKETSEWWVPLYWRVVRVTFFKER